MIIRKAYANGKTFKLELILDDKHIRLVKDVLGCLEGQTIDVSDTNNKWKAPWEGTESAEDEELIFNRLQGWLKPKDFKWEKVTPVERGLVEIPVLDWLPIVCRSIVFSTTFGRSCQSSFNPILYAFDLQSGVKKAHIYREDLEEYMERINPFPDTPENCYGRFSAGAIELDGGLRRSEDAFRFVLAHELKQAIDKLGIIYPALIDWEGFCFNVLRLGSCTIEDFDNSFTNELMLGSKHPDLDELESCFGSIIHIWHRGYEELVGVKN